MRVTKMLCALMLGVTSVAAAQNDGLAVIKKMHDKYERTWYKTLTFTQKTTFTRPDGARDTATWYEAVKGPDLLRIDIRSPAEGNGMVYFADSSVVMRNGEKVRVRPEGNPFMPLIMGAYLQPPERTAAQLAKFGFDMKRTAKGTWEGRPVMIVGTDSPTDSTSAQFWIDTDRLVLVRARIGFAPNQPLLDIHVGGYEKIGNAWLATRIEIISGSTVVQDEQYEDWKVNLRLDDALFDPAQWRTARHWKQ